MPVIDSHGCPIDVEVTGPADAPVLMLSSSLGTTKHMWDPQMEAFAGRYRVVRYDRRGHGRSGVPKGPYTMELLARDAIAVMDGLGLKKVNWLGLSMGGMEGMWLGAHAPERIEKLILSNTSTYYPDKTPWHTRIDTVTKGGSVAAIADTVINAWLTQNFQKSNPDVTARMKEMMIATPVEGYLGCCAAVRDMDHREIIKAITAPTLIIAGSKDMATNVEAAEFIRDRIKGSKLAIVDAAHIANVEQSEAYAKEVIGFLG
ncbi:3-oxoadipate enol-lactonase [Pseudorhodoplanes sinuspersici]|uniref:3-oxoadipate enol-lactonase n=1 Tax=Pseudorhodoplanes sinuspersici TaxID=1235591 RepID=A0A1W6ZUU2_9HYPH|nr:3-oxoadipate enol-lactonase [Pseudorhodoplanes sinuspersici]ARQ01177.1 3-oxoadipate enol-lactonase [Pseudorhodoplanes sinuspersici]RKE72836.1 3-oxoadipate enol-lactonase [Pseudorhodoplanes sinuspersici]